MPTLKPTFEQELVWAIVAEAPSVINNETSIARSSLLMTKAIERLSRRAEDPAVIQAINELSPDDRFKLTYCVMRQTNADHPLCELLYRKVEVDAYADRTAKTALAASTTEIETEETKREKQSQSSMQSSMKERQQVEAQKEEKRQHAEFKQTGRVVEVNPRASQPLPERVQVLKGLTNRRIPTADISIELKSSTPNEVIKPSIDKLQFLYNLKTHISNQHSHGNLAFFKEPAKEIQVLQNALRELNRDFPKQKDVDKLFAKVEKILEQGSATTKKKYGWFGHQVTVERDPGITAFYQQEYRASQTAKGVAQKQTLQLDS